MMRRLWLGALGMMMAAMSGPSQATEALVTAEEWSAYTQAFLADDGRIVDAANGNISHSEGQGYGLLLSYYAGDHDTFRAIWAFTKDELMIRPDGLSAWKWDPAAEPHVTDTNNASDGDILIAYALGLAGYDWKDDDLLKDGRTLADAIGRTSTMRWRGRDILLPAEFGFRRDDQPDGPVINLSYWVFEAFPMLARLAPSTDWDMLAINGRRLVAEAKFGPNKLPSDWISLRQSKPAPADEFPAEFGYNSIRIPLYLLRGGTTEHALLKEFIPALKGDEASTQMVTNAQPLDPLREPGYQIIGAAVDCVLNGQPVPTELLAFQPESYYGSTLQLLTLSFLRQSAQKCL